MEKVKLVKSDISTERIARWRADGKKALGIVCCHTPFELLHAADQDLPGLAEIGLRPAKLFDTEVAARVAGLERVGLGDRLQSRPDQLSGGQQQRVAIARALSTEPALILADEPTGNLDSRSATEIGELLREISAAYGRSVLMVTHDPRIAGFAERLVLMRDGRIIDDLDLDDAPEGPRLALERAGLL